MIKELFQYVTTPALPLAKTWGYLYESIALENRYARCAKNWAPHLSNCHQFFKENIPNSAKSVTVLGSGLAVEVPRDYIVDRFEKVYLVDLVHPRSVRKWAKDHPNVELIEADITGVLSQLEAKIPIRKVKMPESRTWPTADYVVSANLISQIHLLPVSNLIRKMCGDREIVNLGIRMIESHLDLLRKEKASIYWSDDIALIKNRRGEIVENQSTVLNVELPSQVKKWYWNVAPFGEVSHFSAKDLCVKAGRLKG